MLIPPNSQSVKYKYHNLMHYHSVNIEQNQNNTDCTELYPILVMMKPCINYFNVVSKFEVVQTSCTGYVIRHNRYYILKAQSRKVLAQESTDLQGPLMSSCRHFR